jgi:hypothetical protein
MLFSHIRLTHPESGRPLLPFPISTRNSPAAVAHLLHITEAKYLWVSQGSMTAIATEALRGISEDNVVLLPFPSFQELYGEISFGYSSDTDKDKIQAKEWPIVESSKPALLLHSSGNTKSTVVDR